MIGTGAISHKHAQAYKNIGFQLTVCTDINEAGGRRFAEQYGAEFVPTYEEVCRHPKVDYVDVCTFPDFRMQPILVVRGIGQARPGAEADFDEPGDGAADGGDGAQGGHHPRRGEPAPVRRCEPVSGEGDLPAAGWGNCCRPIAT